MSCDDKPCKVCKEKNCYAHCQDSASGEHEVAPDSADSSESERDNVLRKDGTIVVDFNCRHCGQSGSVGVHATDIAWS